MSVLSPPISPQMSSYFEGLQEDKRRYKDKIALINGNDPFGKIVDGEPFNGIVPVDSCDLVSYLVLQTSFMMLEQFKDRKGLEAYNSFCVWLNKRCFYSVYSRKIPHYWSSK